MISPSDKNPALGAVGLRALGVIGPTPSAYFFISTRLYHALPRRCKGWLRHD